MSKRNPRAEARKGPADPFRRRTLAPFLIGGAAVAAVVAVLGLIVAGQFTSGETKVPERTVTAPGRILGNPDAPVKIVEYADFQCPYCKMAEEKVARLVDEYVTPGKASLEFRNFAFLGDESVLAAEASLCAEDQGKFWEYHDALFRIQGRENSGVYSSAKLVELAQEVGLDVEAFQQCMESEKHRQDVLDEREAAKKAGVSSTPTFFVNDTVVKGNVPYSDFVDAIEAELAKAQGEAQP
ncbi:MAG TPA: DsbA family protein [Dehalococcoidia bacterium]|nr:DsbA family protein [Dehalococcoidia bacterium]